MIRNVAAVPHDYNGSHAVCLTPSLPLLVSWRSSRNKHIGLNRAIWKLGVQHSHIRMLRSNDQTSHSLLMLSLHYIAQNGSLETV